MRRALRRPARTGSPRRRPGAFLFHAFQVVLLVVLAGAWAARYLDPRYFWPLELLAVGLPYLSMLVVLLAPFVLASRRPAAIGLHALALVLIAVRFVPWGRARDTTPAGPDLVLLTYNVPNYYGNFTPEERARNVLGLVRREQPHVVSLQEAGITYPRSMQRPPGTHPYVRVLMDSAGFRAPGPDRTQRVYTQQPTSGRIPIRAQQQYILRPVPGDPAQTQVIRTEFEWQGRQAALYNVHMWSYGEDKPWRDPSLTPLEQPFWRRYLRQYRDAYISRAYEAAQIRTLLAAERLPFIVCGDLNSTPHNRVYRLLTESFGLQDAFLLAGRGWGGTYHSRLPLARIDFVLASPEWYVVEAHVPGVRYSDHRPLVARLRWRAP